MLELFGHPLAIHYKISKRAIFLIIARLLLLTLEQKKGSQMRAFFISDNLKIIQQQLRKEFLLKLLCEV